MTCKYLNIYHGDRLNWQVATCSARNGRYAPSLADLEFVCNENHEKCPFYIRGQNRLKSLELSSRPLPNAA